MATELLRVNGISAGTEEKSILHSIDLSIGDGQAHVLILPIRLPKVLLSLTARM